MDIYEIKEKRNALAREIFIILHDKFEKFRKETGISITDVDARFRNITSWDDRSYQYVLETIELELGYE